MSENFYLYRYCNVENQQGDRIRIIRDWYIGQTTRHPYERHRSHLENKVDLLHNMIMQAKCQEKDAFIEIARVENQNELDFWENLLIVAYAPEFNQSVQHLQLIAEQILIDPPEEMPRFERFSFDELKNAQVEITKCEIESTIEKFVSEVFRLKRYITSKPDWRMRIALDGEDHPLILYGKYGDEVDGIGVDATHNKRVETYTPLS